MIAALALLAEVAQLSAATDPSTDCQRLESPIGALVRERCGAEPILVHGAARRWTLQAGSGQTLDSGQDSEQ